MIWGCTWWCVEGGGVWSEGQTGIAEEQWERGRGPGKGGEREAGEVRGEKCFTHRSGAV